MNSIVLIGMPGTGKSTVGAILSKKIGYRLLDTDRLIVEKARRTLPQLIAEKGVEGFLTLEGQVGAELRCNRCVIATGGSMVLSEAAMRNLCDHNQVIWLDTSLDELQRRIRRSADRGIAAAPGATVADIDAVRRPLYQKYATLRITGITGAENVADQIIQALGFHRKQG